MMKFVFSFVLVLVVVVSQGSGSIEKRIVGSKSCDKERQYHVQIESVQKGKICGGALLNPQWVITASHCAEQLVRVKLGLTNDVSFFKKMTIKAKSFFKGPSKKYTQEIQTSQQFTYKDEEGNAHDIMLIKLTEVTSGGLPTIKLPPTDCTKPAAGEQVEIGGWGSKTSDVKKAKTPGDLRCASTKITECGENDKPDSKYSSDESAIMCAFEGGVEACSGDAGTAVEYNNVLYGIIVSNPVDKCANPIVMANICHYRQWIDDTMKQNA